MPSPASVSPPPQRFPQPAALIPTFTDPQRRAKLLALLPKLDAHFAERAARAHMPGLAVGLVVDGDLLWSKGYGVRDLTTKAPVDADTIFRLASVTKSFTGMAMLQLRDAGKLSLDDPAEKYLPELAGLVYPTHDSPRITLRNLLTHTAGLPHDAPLPLDETHPWPTDAAELASLQGMQLDSAPGVRQAYSNLGFVLAGMVVARVSGTSYADYLASHVLQPLGMTSTGFAPPRDRLASGYVKKGDATVQPPMIDLGTAPSGGLFSTVRDLARYAAFQLSAWPPRDDADGAPLLRSSAREAQQMWSWDRLSVGPLRQGKHLSATAAGYGYGWVSYETCDWDKVVWHNGGFGDGYRSMVLLLPDRGVAIVALANLVTPNDDLESAAYDAAQLLGDAGALPKRELVPTPTLLAARDAIMALRVQWDDALAKRIFFDNVPAAEEADYRRDLAKGLSDHGACHVVSTTAESSKQLRFEIACDRGSQEWHVILGDDMRVHWSWGEDRFPPDPRLVKAATTLAGLVSRWDERRYEEIAAGSVEQAKVKEVFAEAGSEHGGCKVQRVDEHGDKLHGRFELACTRGGALELRASMDEKSGKVTGVELRGVVDEGRKCP